MDLALRSPNRLFAALDLPDEMRAELALRAGELAARLGGRAVPEQNLHVTLDFLGDVALEHVADVVTAFGAVHGPALRLGIGGPVAHPSARRARLIAAQIDDEEGLLGPFGERLRVVLAAALGRETSVHRLWPHVTLVRLRRPTRVQMGGWKPCERLFDASRASLYDSVSIPNWSPRYVPLAAVDLGTPVAPRRPTDG